MATVLGIVLASLVGIVLVALLVPVHVVAHGTFTDTKVDGHTRLSWGFGLVRLDVSPVGAELRMIGVRVHRFVAGARRPAKKPRRKTRVDPFLLSRILRRSIASLGLHARVAGRLGTGDPADTASLFAVVAAARMFRSRLDTDRIEIAWTERALDLDGEVEGWVWPIAIASIAIGEVVRARRPLAARRGAA